MPHSKVERLMASSHACMIDMSGSGVQSVVVLMVTVIDAWMFLVKYETNIPCSHYY